MDETFKFVQSVEIESIRINDKHVEMRYTLHIQG